MNLRFRRVENLVPQPRVIDRERVGFERGGDDGRQVGVVAMVEDLVEFVLRPNGTRAALFQVIENQHGGGLDLVEAAIKRNVRGGAEGLAHVVEQVGHFHERGLSAQVNAIVADGRREVSLSAERTAQQHEPAFGFLRERNRGSDRLPQGLEILLRHFDARNLLVLDLVAEAILFLGGGGRHRFLAEFILARLEISECHHLHLGQGQHRNARVARLGGTAVIGRDDSHVADEILVLQARADAALDLVQHQVGGDDRRDFVDVTIVNDLE